MNLNFINMDLMIGDWFLNKISGEPMQLKSPSEFNYEKAMKPIPLTPEILEKNGFVVEQEEYEYLCSANDGYYRITLVDLQDGLWTLDILDYDKFNDVHKEVKFESTFLKVHELQQAMRLCGIVKEIKV